MEHLNVWTLPELFIFLLQFKRGLAVSMLARGQQYVLQAKDPINMDCEFYADEFSWANNSVSWKKEQIEEETIVCSNWTLHRPYSSTSRYKVKWLSSPPRYRLILTISALHHEDIGNYTCEVTGPTGRILSTVQHKVFVKSPVDDIVIVNSNNTQTDPVFRGVPSTMDFIEGFPGPLQCIAMGGYPVPMVSLSIRDVVSTRDISDQLTLDLRFLLKGTTGLRRIIPRVYLWTNKFMVTPEHHGKLLMCSVYVPGYTQHGSSTVIHVQYAPLMTCVSRGANVYSRSAYVACHVKANPRVLSLYWIVDANGTMLAEEDTDGEYRIVNLQRPDGTLESKLFINEIQKGHFKTYTMVADNSVGSTSSTVDLFEGHATGHGRKIDIYARESSLQGRSNYILLRSGASNKGNWSMSALLFLAMLVLCLCMRYSSENEFTVFDLGGERT